MERLTKEQVQKTAKENIEGTVVFTLAEFMEEAACHNLLPTDGSGYFHNGWYETDKSVFSTKVSFYEACESYPYVCWYNK